MTSKAPSPKGAVKRAPGSKKPATAGSKKPAAAGSKKPALAKKAPATKRAATASKASRSAVATAEGPDSEMAAPTKALAEAKELLLAERATYAEQAQSLKAEADLLVEEAEPGDIQFDEESGEGGTMTVDRERDLALAGQAKAAVEEIDHALAKVEAGTYGICERCHQRIPRPRLKALPYARLCVACKSGGLSRR